MRYQRAVRTAVCVVCAGIAVSVAGCGVSFCGLQYGGRNELVFSCGDSLMEKTEHAEVNEEEESVSEISGSKTVGADGRVNINSAGVEELMTLNGIGETRAEAIVEYRIQNGAFTKAEEIMQVPGIKEGIFSKIQDQITVN